MPTSIRTYYGLLHVTETLLAVTLTAGAFLMLQHWTVPFPWAWSVLGTTIILLTLGHEVYVGYGGDDAAPIHAILFAIGTSIILGLACHAAIGQGKDVELFLGRVSWVAVGAIPAYLGIRDLWETGGAQDEASGLPGLLFHRELARIACDQDAPDEYRRASALQLRLPDDEDALRQCLSTLEGYRTYDLSYGWPHVHDFMDASLDVTGDDEHSTLTSRERCRCGVTRTRVIERRAVGTERICPHCGGEVGRVQEDIWMGGHFTYEDLYVCSGCGRDSDVDFSVERPVYEERIVSEAYA